MPLNTFAPNTKVSSALVNDNFAHLADGTYDLPANQLALWRRQAMANFVVGSGGTIPTSGTLIATMAAIVYYVNGKYVSLGATAITFQASKDTYVDLKDDGTIVLVPVANNATSGMTMTTNTDGSNAFRIGKAVTSGTAVTSVVQGGIDFLGNVLYNTDPFGTNIVFFPSYQNSWTDYDTNLWGPGYYYIDKAGRVGMQGLIHNGTTTNGLTLFALPVGMRPGVQVMITATTNGAVCNLHVTTGGLVAIDSNVQSTWLSIASVHFLALN